MDYNSNPEFSAIHAACTEGDVPAIRAALLEGERVINSYNEGFTPLHTTVLSGTAHAHDVIPLLLNHGADINMQTRGEEDTALHLVVEHGEFPRDFALVMQLLENNIDLSVRNKKLRTAYDCAMGKGLYELASTLDGSMPPEQSSRFYEEKIGEKYGPFITAAVLRSDREMLEENLRLGGNPDLLNKHGAGAIHYAITHCTLPVMEVLRTLIEGGADVNLRDEEGDNALNLAIKSSKLRESGQMLDVVQFLVDYGADPTFKDLDGKDAYMMAEERGYDDVLHILRAPRQLKLTPRQKEEFPDPNAPNDEGLYPIHIATMRENPSERQALIENLTDRGALVSQVTEEEGNTALHICALLDIEDTAQQLLEHNIDYTITNNDGKTAYEVATDLGHEEVATAIEAKQKEVQDKWKKGKKAGLCAIL